MHRVLQCIHRLVLSAVALVAWSSIPLTAQLQPAHAPVKDASKEAKSEVNEKDLETARSMMNREGIIFVENQGQITDSEGKKRSDIAYTASIGSVQLFFTPQGVSYVFLQSEEKSAKEGGRPHTPEKASLFRTYRMDMQFIGSNPDVKIISGDAADGIINYYQSNSSQKAISVRRYNSIVYKNMYSNIDVVYYSTEEGLKYDFIVHPGGKVADIQFRYNGADKLEITQEGSLKITNPVTYIEEAMPYTYQKGLPAQIASIDNGGVHAKRVVKSAYRLDGDVVRFDIGTYDPASELIIDPSILWGKYVGGEQHDRATGVTINPANGDVYVTGFKASIFFPANPGAQSVFGGLDAFQMKYTAAGTFVYSMIVGGSADDYGMDVAYIPSGNLAGWSVITGYTQSWNFYTLGAYQPVMGGGSYDAFMTYVTPAGLIFVSSYYGGTGNDFGFGVQAIPTNGFVAFTGTTSSTGLPITPVMPSNFRQAAFNGGNTDAFVAVFNYSSAMIPISQFYWGGPYDDGAYDVEAYPISSMGGYFAICGWTASSTLHDNGWGGPDFGGYNLSQPLGTTDAFMAKFEPYGTFFWSHIHGGIDQDSGRGLAIKEQSSGIYLLYMIGSSLSTTLQSASGTPAMPQSGGWDAFVSQFRDVSNRCYSDHYTFIGSTDNDHGYGISHGMDRYGAECFAVTGYTDGTDLYTHKPIQLQNNSVFASGWKFDAFIGKLDGALSPMWMTYYGGQKNDYGQDVAVYYNSASPVNSSFTAVGWSDSDNLMTGIGISKPDPFNFSDDVWILTLSDKSHFATYLGGSSDDIITDLEGNESHVMVGGYTASTNFPVNYGYGNRGNTDVFATKFDANGRHKWTTIFGGIHNDQGLGIDDAGNYMLITGWTESYDFPMLTPPTPYKALNPWANTVWKYTDAFVIKLAPSDGQWLAGTLYGGRYHEIGHDVVGMSDGKIAITGSTQSYDIPLISQTYSYSGGVTGQLDVFLAVFDTDLSALQWATCYGGQEADDVGKGIDRNPSNDLYVTGYTKCTTGFQHTVGTGAQGPVGVADVFMLRYRSNGVRRYAQCYGAFNNNQFGNRVAVNSGGTPFIVGTSEGTGAFPAILSTQSGLFDAFVLRCSNSTANGNAQNGYYVGGPGNDEGLGVAVDYYSTDGVAITGLLASSGGPYVPINSGSNTGIVQTYIGGTTDAFAARFNISAATATPLWSTFYGGTGADEGRGIAIAGLGDVFVGGNTKSSAIGGTSVNSYQQNKTGGTGNWDGFVVRIYGVNGASYGKEYTGGDITPEESVESAFPSADLQIYPNPNTGYFTLAVDVPKAISISLELNTLLGERVMSVQETAQAGQYSRQVNMEQFPTGVYMLNVRLGERTLTYKVVKE